MALNAQQLTGLNAASTRKVNGTANAADLAAINNAQKNLGYVYKPTPTPTPTPKPTPTPDPLASMANQFGAAGGSFQDYVTAASGANAVTADQKNKVYSDLGINDLESKAFALPTQSSEDLYKSKYSELGLQSIKDQITALNDQITSRKSDLAKATNSINENPWFSEARRVGEANRLQNLANSDINNLIDQHTNLSDLYNSGLTELNNHVTRVSNDFNNNATANKSKLDYLQKKAESQISDINSANQAKVYRYAQDYLTSANDNKLVTAGYTPLSTPAQLKGLKESDIMRIGSKIYKKPTSATVTALMTKYPDAGITSQDSEATANAKLKNSKIYQKETDTGKTTWGVVGTNEDGTPKYGFIDTGNKTITGGDGSTSGATYTDGSGNVNNVAGWAANDSSKVASMQKTADMIGKVTNENIAQKVAQFTPGVTADAIKQASAKFGVSWESLMTQIVQESTGGTSNVARKNNNFGGLTFNNQEWIKQFGGTKGTARPASEGGNYIKFPTVQDGVNALASLQASYNSRITNTNQNKPVDAEYIKALVADPKTKISDIKGKNATETAALVKAYVTEKAKSGSISAADAKQTTELNDKVTLIDGLIDDLKGTWGAGTGVVGPTAGARWSGTSHLTGAEQNFVGGVKQLTSKETLDTLINLKKSGGTLGALSDQERLMLQNAATKIGGWEIKDKNGNGTGQWAIDENSFTKELQRIKELAQKAIKNAGGDTGIVNTLEQNLASNPDKVNDYNAIVAANPNLSDDEINQVLFGNQ